MGHGLYMLCSKGCIRHFLVCLMTAQFVHYDVSLPCLMVAGYCFTDGCAHNEISPSVSQYLACLTSTLSSVSKVSEGGKWG